MLGAVLLQGGQPVAYVSRALMPVETRYAQIEKECLAIVYAAERFDHYIFGCDNVWIQSNHQSLEMIFKKSLSSAASRLQRMLLRLQRYNLCISYPKGSEMVLVDTLSRGFLPFSSTESSFVNLLESIESQSSVSQSTHTAIKEATSNDAVLTSLRQMILDG